MTTGDDPHQAALDYLRASDARMAALIDRAGPCRLKQRPSGAPRREELFSALAESITSQQLSPKAAETIFGRVRALVGEPFGPSRVLAHSEEALKSAGLSGAKARGLRDLAERVGSGELVLEELHALDDEAVIAALSAVRGIGRWTAEMVLIFQLGRLDVLPVGDLGVQKGFQRLFKLRERPLPHRMHELARPFAPYRSIASWYMWRINEEPLPKERPRAPAKAKKTAAEKKAAPAAKHPAIDAGKHAGKHAGKYATNARRARG